MIILCILALVIAVAAFIRSGMKKESQPASTQTTAPKTEDVNDHPFRYDVKKGVYILDGSLEVTGSISCLKTRKEDSDEL